MATLQPFLPTRAIKRNADMVIPREIRPGHPTRMLPQLRTLAGRRIWPAERACEEPETPRPPPRQRTISIPQDILRFSAPKTCRDEKLCRLGRWQAYRIDAMRFHAHECSLNLKLDASTCGTPPGPPLGRLQRGRPRKSQVAQRREYTRICRRLSNRGQCETFLPQPLAGTDFAGVDYTRCVTRATMRAFSHVAIPVPRQVRGGADNRQNLFAPQGCDALCQNDRYCSRCFAS